MSWLADFKSKKIRVNINQAIRSDKQAESTEVLKAVDEDRKFVYQASIVRCVLLERSIQHSEANAILPAE